MQATDPLKPYVSPFTWRSLARYLWLAVPIAVGWCALPASMGWYSGSAATGDSVTVTLVEDWVVHAIPWIAVASLLALIALGVWKRRLFPHPISVVVAGFAFACGPVFLMGGRALSASVAGPDGRTYAFFHHTILQGRTAYLCRVTSDVWFARTADIVAPDDGEFGFTYASLVRPASAPSDGTWVATTRDGLLLGMVGGNAYRGMRPGELVSISTTEVQSLSPFVLLADAGDGVEDDVETIAQTVRENVRIHGRERAYDWAHPDPHDADEFRSGTPTEVALLAALDHPNPWVRTAVRSIAQAGGADVYPEVLRRLDAVK